VGIGEERMGGKDGRRGDVGEEIHKVC